MLRLVKETEGGKSKWVARTVERKQMQECPGAVTAVQEEQARDQAAKQERSKGWGLYVTLFFGSLNAKESREGLTARATWDPSISWLLESQGKESEHSGAYRALGPLISRFCHPNDLIPRWSWGLKRTEFYLKSERLWTEKPNESTNLRQKMCVI